MDLLDLAVKVTCKDEATSKIESISSWTVAKGVAIGQTMLNAMSRAGEAIMSVGSQALSAYSSYEQLTGGVETLFKNAAGTVLDNAKSAYKTAGVSANQYMEQATSFAASLISSVVSNNRQIQKTDVDALESSLKQQYEARKKSLAEQLSLQKDAYDDEYDQRKKAYQKQYSSYSQQLSDEIDALKEANSERLDSVREAQEQEVKEYEAATEAKIRLIDQEYNESLKLIDEEEYRRVKAIDDQIDAIEAQGEAEKRSQKKLEQEQKKANLRRAIDTAKTAEERAKASEELNAYLAKLAQEEREEARKQQIAQLRDQKDAIKEQTKTRKQQLKEQRDAEIAAIKESRAAQLEVIKSENQRELSELKKSQDTMLKQQQRANADRLAQMKEDQSTELDNLRRAQQQQLDRIRESNEQQLEDIQRANDERIRMAEEANNATTSMVDATEAELEEAARLANVAIVDMADNANKMGSTMESIQNAYQGFSKGNFTMLDNLKLGFGGTKTEMERLLETAEDMKLKQGEVRDYSIDSFADIVDAIHTVQQEYEISGYAEDELAQKIENRSLTEQELRRVSQDLWSSHKSQYQDEEDAYNKVVEAYQNGSLTVQDALILTGTTSYEASQTVEGSMNSLKAAWDNWLIAVTTGEGDIGEATETLFTSIGTVVETTAPVIQTALETLFKYIDENGPEIFGKLKTAILDSLPPEWKERAKEILDKLGRIIDKVGDTVESMGGLEGIVDKVMNAFDTFGSSVETVTNILGPFAPVLTTVGLAFLALSPVIGVFKGIASIVSTVTGLFGPMGSAASAMGSAAAAGAGEAAAGATGAAGALGGLGSAASGAGSAIVGVLGPAAVAGGAMAGVGLLTNSIFEATGATERFHKIVEDDAYDATESFTHMSDTAQTVNRGVTDSFGTMQREIETATKKMSDDSDTNFKDMVTGISNSRTNAEDNVNGMANSITGAFSNSGWWLYSAGSSIISGLWNGMNAVWNNLSGWISGIGNWIAQHKGPKEYDLKLLVKNGQWIMSGLETGLRSQFPEIGKTLDDLGSYIESGVTARIGDGISVKGDFSMDDASVESGGGPVIYVGEMVVREEADIYRVARELDVYWKRETAGGLA